MYKWLQFIDNKSRRYWNQKRYIIVNKPVDNSYLGWKPSRKDSYIVSLDNTGAIEYYYTFSNGVWQKYKDSTNGENPTYDTFEFTTSASNGTISVNVNTPNEYSNTTDTITHKTIADVEITLTATPSEGYEFVKWQRGEEDLSDTNTTIIIHENNDVVYTAVFEETE